MLAAACSVGCSTIASMHKKPEEEVSLRIHEEASSSLPAESFTYR